MEYDRQTIIQEHIYLYEGLASEVFGINRMGFRKNDEEAKRLYVQRNVFKLITDTFVNLSLYEFPTFVFDEDANQEFFDEWVKDNLFEDKLQDMMKTASILGDCVCILYQDDFEKWGVKTIQNEIWEPEYDQYDLSEEATINHLNYEYEIDKKTYNIRKTYDYDKINNETTISYKAFENGQEVEMPDKIKEKLGLKVSILDRIKSVITQDQTIISQTLPGKLFFRLKNENSLRSYFGQSDYTPDIKALAENINDLLELAIFEQYKLGNPILAIPQSVLDSIKQKVNDKTEKSGDVSGTGTIRERHSNIRLRGTDYTPQEMRYLSQTLKDISFFPLTNSNITGEDNKPSFIQAQSTIEYIEISIDRLITQVEQVSSLPTIFFNKDASTGNLSGVALLRLIQNTLHRKHSKEIKLTSFLSEIIFNLLSLSGGEGEKPSITYYDGIINNKLEQVEEVEGLLSNGLITKLKAIKLVNNCSEKEAENILQNINAEKGEIPYIENMPSLSENLTIEADVSNQSRD